MGNFGPSLAPSKYEDTPPIISSGSREKSTIETNLVLRKCIKRYENRFPDWNEQKKEEYYNSLSKQLVDPDWLSKQLFDKQDVLVVKLLLIPVAPSIFAHLAKFTGTDYGYLHTGLQINGVVIDWDLTGLVVPRKFANKIYSALDINSAGTQSMNKSLEVLKNVTEVIVKWNQDYEYQTFTRNCQHFVNEIIKALGIKLSWNPSIASYIKDIKEDPKNVIPHIEYKLDGKMVRKKFETHQELDDFVEEFSKNDPIQYSALDGLLKSFDRGFWFRERSVGIFKDPKTCRWGIPTKYEPDFSSLIWHD